MGSHALDHSWLAAPDPYEQPTPVVIGNQPGLGTERPVAIAQETHRSTPAMTEDGETTLAPDRESDDYAVLAAWYSGFAYAEHYRKVVQAQCREIVRAQYVAKGDKITEARLDDLARVHPLYLDYLARHLDGRTKWEAAYRAAGGLT